MTSGQGGCSSFVMAPETATSPSQLYAAEAKCDALGIPRHDQDAGGVSWRSYRQFTREMDWD